MSNVSKRKVTTTRHEYFIPTPAAAQDVQKAIDWALRDMPEDQRGYGDAFWLTGDEDEVVIWWEEKP